MLELMQAGDTFTVCDAELPKVEDGDPEVFYTLRRLDPKTHRQLLKSHTKHQFERGVGKVDKVDHNAAADDILDYVLVGWKGVNIKGQPAPCERELKLAGLDFTRRNALVDKAGLNEIKRAAEGRAESFRPPA